MSKTILLNQSDWHFTKENPGICLLYTSDAADEL